VLDQDQVERLVQYWTLGSYDDLAAAEEVLLQTKRYATALFHMHLSLEKLLKAKVVKCTAMHPPYTHNLVHLASKLSWLLTETQTEFLSEVSQFNLSNRYPTEKEAIRSFATKKLAEEFIVKTREAHQWISSK
jgi:HEPN domain-containing protein